ncbi:hypothetical protein A4X13_0g783 [Tilletia indica]|uniref:Uncharacterized protein n=1 Tax=Tilletia indica TaxID=43049 RepID=A0A177TQD5_9BASI|nr:hypothetical protein A4X13_0g783 [Tilletia indica]
MALQTNKPYTLLPFSARQDQPETPPIIHLRLRPQTVQLAQSASSLSIDINSAQGSAIILDGARHELLHSEEAASTDLYEISNREEDSLTRVGPIRDRFSERPADINAAGQRLKERREEEEAKRAEHRTVLLDAPASLKRSGLVHASSSAIPRSSSLSSLHRAARQSSETPSARGSPIIGGRAQSRPNLITAESIRAASPAPSSVNPNHSPSREHNHTAGTATAPPPPSASPYSSPRFSLRTRLVQFLALGPKPRRQIVAALSAPETQVLALLSKVADRPSELQPDLTAASSPAPQSAGSPQLGGSARFAGPVNRRITNAAPPARPQGHLSPSTVYILKDSVYLDEVNIDSWTAYSLQERRIVSKHAHEAFKRLGVNAENDPAGWSKLYPDGWPTEAQLRREREREELDRDPNFAMRDDEVLSEIDSDELEREFGNYANSSQHGQQQQQRRARRKRRRDYGSGSASGSPESSSELSDVPDTLPPLPISGRIIAKGRSPPPLSSSSSNSSLGASLGAKLKTLSTSVSMPSMSPTLTPTEKPPPKKKGLSTLERISRAAKGKGPSASERDKQIQKARKQVEGGLGLPTNNKTGKEKDPGSSQELSQGKMSVGSKTATSKRSGHSHQQSLPSMDFSMLHDIGRLRQEGSSSGAQEVRRTSSLTRLEQRGIGSSTASSSKLGNHSGGTAIAASVSPAASNSSTKLAQRERDRSSMGREKSQYTSAGSPPPSSKGGTKKLKKRPQRRDIEFTDSSDDEDGDGGEGGKTEGGSGSTSALSKKKSLKGSSAGVASQSSSKLGNVRARSSANSPLPRSHGSDSGSTVKDGSRTANRQSGSGSTTFVAKTKTNGMSGLSKAEREAYSLPGSMIRSHRGVGPGAHASAEPWLELRSVGDWHLLAERFLRVYGMYRTGRETIDRERERLVGEMEAAEREAQWKRQVEEREALRAAAAAGAAAAAAAVAAESEKVDVKAKEDQHQHSEAQPRAGDRIREDSPEEGEMTPEQTHVALPAAIPPPPISMPVSASDTLGQMDSTSALGIDMAPPTAVSNGHMDDPSIPLSWRAHRAENDHVETTRGRLGPGFSVNTMMASSGLRGSALYGTGGLNHGSANSNPVLVGSRSPSTSRLGTSGPIPLAELEELVGKCKVWQGELYRMKRALVFFKRKIEAQEGRASESEAEAEVMEGEEGEGDRSRPAVVMGLGLETTASASAGVVDGDGDVRMG